MKKIIELNVLIIVFSIIYMPASLGADKILPLPKPALSKETKLKISKKGIIYPQKKPLTKKTKIETEIKKENEILKAENKTTSIYPKKKPIVVKKKASVPLKKSDILSKKDFKIAKAAFNYVDKRRWQSALKLSRKARDKTLYNLISYLHLIQQNNLASFNDYTSFIRSNSYYPRISRLRYLAEHKINLKKNKPVSIIRWFDGEEPLSDFGKIKLGEIFLLQGNDEKGSKLIKEGWIKAKLTKNDLKYLRKKYKNIIKVSDNISRTEWHAWESKHYDVQRMLRYLPKEETLLYKARLSLMTRSYGVDSAINKVPEKFKNDIGLQYDRLKWRRRRGRLEPSLEILFKIPNDPNKLIRPDVWWKERAILARSLIYKKKYALAYKVSSNHSLTEGNEYAEAEWLSGWVALTFLNDPNMAVQHFKNFYENVSYPISVSRGAYWLGQTYKVLGNNQKSKEWFNKASIYLNTYYGQLAFKEINNDKYFSLEDLPKISYEYKKEFNKNKLIKSVLLLGELNKSKYTKDFLNHLALVDVEKGSEILAAKLAIEIGRYDYAIQISKRASYEKRFYNELNYPIIETPKIVNKKKMPKPALVLSIIRQESEFDQKANSDAGAQGMMQLMTYTAKLVSKQANLSYSKSKLKTDPNYNIKLGSYYVASLLENYEGSYVFALAAYNAGPKRVKYWKKINGNPQKGTIDYVNWIELIKFKETRNYVQRVLENINVYRYMVAGKPIRIYNFFEDTPHY